MTAHLVLLIAWLAWWLSWVAASAWSGQTVERAGARPELLHRVLSFCGIVLLFGFYWRRDQVLLPVWRVAPALAWLLVALALLGFALAWWARLHLGRLWSSSVTRKADHHLVDTGPYALVRHPIYTGVIAATVATAVECGTGVAALGAALMVAGWYVKARLEERFLRDRLGREDYEAYARRVPMLMPMLPARAR